MSKVKYAFYETPSGYKVTGGTSTQFLKADGTRDSNTYSLSNHTHTFVSITSKPTTVSGYGITDAISVDLTTNLSNPSTTTPANWKNKVWFDYNWAGQALPGSVISFSGLPNGSYAVELFGNYGDGNTFGFRTRNGDTNQWNPHRFVWHTGNFNPSNYVTLGTPQNIAGIKVFQGANGNDYNQAAIMINGNGVANTIYPGIGFHQPGAYAGSIQLRSDGNFGFYMQGGTSLAHANAASFKKEGGTATQFLKADGSVDGTAYAINNGTVDWYSAAFGIINNPTINNRTLNAEGQTTSLQNATQGSASGIINTSGTLAGNPTDNWFHRLKMLHNNAAGYYTEIAVQMTGGTSMWFKTFEAGTLKNPNNVNGWVQAVDTLNDQTIFGLKTFINAVTAPSFYESSLRELKENIKTFEKSGLELVEELDVVTFDRKDKSAVNKIGIIANDSPKEFLSEEKDSVDLYKTVFIQARAIQELKTEVDELKELVSKLLNKK